MAESQDRENDHKQCTACINQFIDLANTMQEEGIAANIISAALMSSSGVYASFVAGGNEGVLTESGVDKVSAMYKQELARIQAVKREDLAGEHSGGIA